MLIRDAEADLLTMLADGGVTSGPIRSGDVATVVEVFRRFAAIPADDAAPADEDGDGVLAQFGTYTFRDTPEFDTDLTRQFVGQLQEDPPLWQLSCTIHWDPTPETAALAQGNLWSFGVSLDDFFAQAAALPGWAWALGGRASPRDLEICFEEVC
ncbi:hypothetical protein AB0L64_27385 [Kribbella sp. NPDC051936]|uniref:hypothetical protein n=1 Tax=Kribbella sp. NPDC051936 TaxID=3154946 RepID=UPI00341F3AA9